MPVLEVCDLHSNRLSGQIPHIGRRGISDGDNTVTPGPSLKFLRLHDNKIGGPVPKEISSLRKLQHLDLSRNQFNGVIPDMSNLTELEFLSLSDNPDFKPGTVPDSVWEMKSLTTLDLKNTSRVGPVPDEDWAKIPQLQILDLGGNSLVRRLPSHELSRFVLSSFLSTSLHWICARCCD
jgi:Leucine-rich repeat (LRR) protein